MSSGYYNVIRKGASSVLRQHRKGQIEYVTFPILEEVECIKHLFSTRLGGVSEGIYKSMNLSYTRGDRKEAVDENFRRIAGILGVQTDQFVCSDQTHTANIRIVTKEDAGKGIVKERDYFDIDGLVTNEKGLVLSTFYADCVPLYFVDPVKEVIALSHSGWKGSVLRIGEKTVETMETEFGCRREDILAAIGPSICKECYEVSEDVADEVKRSILELSSRESKGHDAEAIFNKIVEAKPNYKYQLDLWELNKFILMMSGVCEEHIQITDICTCDNYEYLFSHRASEGKRGNLGAFLMLKS